MFDPISVAEIAEMLGVTRQKVASLKHHGKLPEPKKILKCGPLWDAKEIADFINKVGITDNRRKK
jgi:hypothetical protein|tara:strand:+ start:2776 stop:2970 length:195 start_codon:yes stop_codon:yes gene_type:complete